MMIKIRRFEEKVGQLYSMGLIGGFCHLYIGQEGVISGIEMLSKKMIVLLQDIGVMLIWLLEESLWKIFFLNF